MPLSRTELALAWAVIGAIVVGVVLLNRRRKHLGWYFLAIVVAIAMLGNLVEAVLV